MYAHKEFGIRIGHTLDPSEVKTVAAWYHAEGRKSRNGINGGRIVLLKLSVGDEITGWFSDGKWGIPVTDPHSKAALEKLLKQCN